MTAHEDMVLMQRAPGEGIPRALARQIAERAAKGSPRGLNAVAAIT